MNQWQESDFGVAGSIRLTLEKLLFFMYEFEKNTQKVNNIIDVCVRAYDKNVLWKQKRATRVCLTDCITIYPTLKITTTTEPKIENIYLKDYTQSIINTLH